MKERISITLDSRILEGIDKSIDGITIRNRSHAIEKALGASLSLNASKHAILLAGGRKIYLSGKKVSKCMTIINGMPIIQHTINELMRNEVRNITIALNSESKDIENYFGNGIKIGAKIDYAYEQNELGTFGAVYNAFKQNRKTEPFFVLNADQVFKMDMEKMYLQHTQAGAVATIALLAAGSSIKRTGVTKMEGIRILEFVEKGGGTGLISTGCYLFSPKVIDYFRLSMSSIERDLFPRLLSDYTLCGFIYPGPWYSLDNDNLEKSINVISEMLG